MFVSVWDVSGPNFSVHSLPSSSDLAKSSETVSDGFASLQAPDQKLSVAPNRSLAVNRYDKELPFFNPSLKRLRFVSTTPTAVAALAFQTDLSIVVLTYASVSIELCAVSYRVFYFSTHISGPILRSAPYVAICVAFVAILAPLDGAVVERSLSSISVHNSHSPTGGFVGSIAVMASIDVSSSSRVRAMQLPGTILFDTSMYMRESI